MKKISLTVGFILGLFCMINAQVGGVKYLIEYNDATDLYDCKIIIEDGSATTYQHRILTEIHYVVVVPTGAQCIIQEDHNPLMNNKDYEGTEAFDWSFWKEKISPNQQPENDFHLICPEHIDKATFNDLFAGDTITLFSVYVDVDPCENSVRPFLNGVDQTGENWTYQNKYKMYVGGEYTESVLVDYEKCPVSDFNETFINIPVNGNVRTNDVVSSDVSYGPSPILSSSPEGSLETLIINIDGTYTFTANTIGTYIYEVPVCFPSDSECLSTTLKFQVVDYLDPETRPIANPDFGITITNTPITLRTLENDGCVVANGCELDVASVTITSAPNQGGSASVDESNGDIIYTPPLDFNGKETLTYTVCADEEGLYCTEAKQTISVLTTAAKNSTFGADDFTSTQQGVSVSGNVSNNDFDPDGDTQSVVPQNIEIPEGTLTLFTTGYYVFEPAEQFFGPVDIPYMVCDNSISMACAEATLHILVVSDLTVNIRVYLEGALLWNDDEISPTHYRPLMRDNLRVSPFNSKRYIPDSDPYGPMSTTSWEGGNEKYTHVKSGLIPELTTIENPTAVFEVTGDDAIVDWVFVELRSKTDFTDIISTRSGLVQRDGDVVDIDGVSGLRFPETAVDDYYVVVRHRNHFGAMTAEAKSPAQLNELVDFTQASTGFFDFGTSKFDGLFDYTDLSLNGNIKSGFLALYGGDFDGNGKIKYTSPNDDLNILFGDVVGYEIKDEDGNVIDYNYNTNYDQAYGYLNSDYNMDSKSRFSNPIDDKNMMYGQLLFYPHNLFFTSSFNFAIEQIPE